MKLGKLTAAELNQNVIGQVRTKRPETVQGAAVGEDCAVLKTDSMVFLSSDPITAAVSPDNDLGGLAVHISCNDIASSGAEPIAVILTIIMPKDADMSDIKRIMAQAQEAADKLNIDIVGGHTEFSDAVNRVVLCATAVGQADKIIKTAGALPGDYLIITKYAALEGTAILATDYASTLNLTQAEKTEAKKCYDLISVVKEGLIMAKAGVRAMHDITEGGVYGCVTELGAGNRNLGVLIDEDKIPLLDITKKICDRLNINPYRLLSSGSMMAATPDPDAVIEALAKAGIKATVIGRFDDSGKVRVNKGGKITEITYQKDEINNVSPENL